MAPKEEIFDAEVTKTDDRFFMTIIDPDNQTVLFSTDLEQRYLDTFYVGQGFGPLEPDLTIQPAVTTCKALVKLSLRGTTPFSSADWSIFCRIRL